MKIESLLDWLPPRLEKQVIVEGYTYRTEATTEREIRDALAARHNDRNSFWLFRADAEFPALGILVNGPSATINYVPRHRDAGFVCTGDLTSSGVTTFFAQPSDEGTEFSNKYVVPWELALEAAIEFAASTEKPRCITWTEL
jgi:Immunity protein Imm1